MNVGFDALLSLADREQEIDGEGPFFLIALKGAPGHDPFQPGDAELPGMAFDAVQLADSDGFVVLLQIRQGHIDFLFQDRHRVPKPLVFAELHLFPQPIHFPQQLVTAHFAVKHVARLLAKGLDAKNPFLIIHK